MANPSMRWCLPVVLLAFVPNPLLAQGVSWRTDYAEARREAVRTGRPLLLDFGTPGCHWCVKLDQTTFRDPAVAKLLNERFIPVKIDAERDPKRAEALGIHSYPTLVIASPEGKVIDRHSGYLEARELLALLKTVRKPEPDTPISAATEDDAIIRCKVIYEK